MKNVISIAFKLLLSFIATSVVAFISMMLCLSAEIGFIYKVLIGCMFICFNLIIAFSSGRNMGEKHTKEHTYSAACGILGSVLSMLPALILATAYIIVCHNGWLKDVRSLSDGLYVILYLIFLAYSPLLSSFVTFNPALNIDLAQPAITYLQNITMPNAVSAPLFYIPIAAFVIAAYLGYSAGNKEQKQMHDIIKKVKKDKNL